MVKDMEKGMQEKMEKTLSVLRHELVTLKAGRANPSLLDRITVEYYGTVTPLNQLANLAAPEPRVLTITPWDAKAIPSIEKAILKSDLGINPSNDGKMIRLAVPQLTEERRKDLVKVIKKLGEDAKVAIRNIRRDANDSLKKLKKDGDITEDALKKSEEDTQKMTDKCIKEADSLMAVKEKEIMEV
jgi:ribosome recycling factor